MIWGLIIAASVLAAASVTLKLTTKHGLVYWYLVLLMALFLRLWPEKFWRGLERDLEG